LNILSRDKIYVESFQTKAALDDLLLKADTGNIKDVLRLLEEQLILYGSLVANCNREAVSIYIEQFRLFEEYFTHKFLNNANNGAISKLFLGLETRYKTEYSCH
jgi:hypothetical protein